MKELIEKPVKQTEKESSRQLEPLTPLVSKLYEEIECLKEENDQLKEQAIKDSLTGAYNYRGFEQIIQKEVERAQRYGSNLSLILFDIDDFKKINDTYGHLAGNYVLKTVAECVISNIRGVDSLARCGGDEFALILPGNEKGADVVADRIKSRIQTMKIEYETTHIPVSISLGRAQYERGVETNPKDFDFENASLQFFNETDQALYENKKGKKNYQN